jgi:hypothetical protein
VCRTFIGILKENLLWPRAFETIEELRAALIEFKEQFNHHWLLNGFGYKTPAQVRMEAHWNKYDAAS